MIRVTTKAYEKVLYNNLIYLDGIALVDDYGIETYSLNQFEGIFIKIEKQVKDLTLDECFKANITSIDFDRFSKHNVIHHYYDGEVSKLYNLNDYIDITDLVKEKNNG